jgi:hypothetical protein
VTIQILSTLGILGHHSGRSAPVLVRRVCWAFETWYKVIEVDIAYHCNKIGYRRKVMLGQQSPQTTGTSPLNHDKTVIRLIIPTYTTQWFEGWTTHDSRCVVLIESKRTVTTWESACDTYYGSCWRSTRRGHTSLLVITLYTSFYVYQLPGSHQLVESWRISKPKISSVKRSRMQRE